MIKAGKIFQSIFSPWPNVLIYIEHGVKSTLMIKATLLVLETVARDGSLMMLILIFCILMVIESGCV